MTVFLAHGDGGKITDAVGHFLVVFLTAKLGNNSVQTAFFRRFFSSDCCFF
jgi:hypothetical protein